MSHCGTSVRGGHSSQGSAVDTEGDSPLPGLRTSPPTVLPTHSASPLHHFAPPERLRACCPGNQNATLLLPISLPQAPVKALEPHPPRPKVIVCSQEGAGPWARLAQGEQSRNQGLRAPTKNAARSTYLSTPGYLLKRFLSLACSVGRATEAQSSYVNCPFLYR